jgi:peptidyl-prolyl cis-trans isomerase A (cyclophilin A)
MPRLLAILLLACLHLTARAQNGLFADFQTSLGNFTCELDYIHAPRTVANFVGLATGERPWLNFATGEVSRKPFYNGLTFHRVVPGFVIQAGSPKGDGSDGPGYTFRDEFDPTLRHSAAGVLSMANSGLNTNGSQFFITLGAPTYLDDVHSVFGKIAAGPFGDTAAGLSALNTIAGTPLDASGSGVPLTPVVIHSVTIRRLGTAQNFNILAQGLPIVGGNAVKIVQPTSTTLSLQIPRAIYSEYWYFESANLSSWAGQRLAFDNAVYPTGAVDVSAKLSQSRYFFRISETAYPGPHYTPTTLVGKTLVCSITSTSLATPVSTTLTFALTAATAGTSSRDGGTAGQSVYQWDVEPYRGRMRANSATIPSIDLYLAHTTATTGVLKGTVYSYAGNPGYTCTGTFTVSP